MDYLRTSGHADGSRERKSTGNISTLRWNHKRIGLWIFRFQWADQRWGCIIFNGLGLTGFIIHSFFLFKFSRGFSEMLFNCFLSTWVLSFWGDSGWLRIAGSIVGAQSPRKCRWNDAKETARFDECRLHRRQPSPSGHLTAGHRVARCFGAATGSVQRRRKFAHVTDADQWTDRVPPVAPSRLEATAGEDGRGRRYGGHRRSVSSLAAGRWDWWARGGDRKTGWDIFEPVVISFHNEDRCPRADS